jgi:uncharacterized protein (DUF2141 family)
MRNLSLVVLVLAVMPLFSFGQFTLKIEISGLESSEGQVLLEFNNEKGEKMMGIAQSIVENQCLIVVNDLKPGKYAFKYFHDKNVNKKLDLKWMGIPKEGFGFSNNAKGTFGPPSLEKMIFVLEGNMSVKCSPTYIKI